MRRMLLSLAVTAQLLSPQAMAQQTQVTSDQPVTVPSTHEGFVAEYGALLKKYPNAGQSFMLVYQLPGRRDIQVRCSASCDWYADVGLCACRPPHGELPR